MTKIEHYLPGWLHRKIKRSANCAVYHNHYHEEYTYWEEHSSVCLLYFEYYCAREVIIEHIKRVKNWGEEHPNPFTVPKPSGG